MLCHPQASVQGWHETDAPSTKHSQHEAADNKSRWQQYAATHVKSCRQRVTPQPEARPQHGAELASVQAELTAMQAEVQTARSRVGKRKTPGQEPSDVNS